MCVMETVFEHADHDTLATWYSLWLVRCSSSCDYGELLTLDKLE